MFYSLIVVCQLNLPCEKPPEFHQGFDSLNKCIEYVSDKTPRLGQTLDALGLKGFKVFGMCSSPEETIV